MMESLIPALYPVLEVALSLSFAQIGFITLAWRIS